MLHPARAGCYNGAEDEVRVTLPARIFWRNTLAAAALGAGLAVAGVWGMARLEGPRFVAPAMAATPPTCASGQGLTFDGANYACVDLAQPLAGLAIVTASSTTPGGGTFGYVEAVCAGGKKIVGGGCYLNAQNNHWFYATYPDLALTKWQCRDWNNRPEARTIGAYAICANAELAP